MPRLRLIDPAQAWPPGMLARFEFPADISSIAVSPPEAPPGCQQWLAVGCTDGTICIFDLQTEAPVSSDRQDGPLSWKGHKGAVTSLAWHADGRLASGGQWGSVAIWDPTRHESPLWQHSLSDEPALPYYYEVALAWHPDGRLAISFIGLGDSVLAVWDTKGGPEPVWCGPRHSSWGTPTCVAWHPDGRLAAGSNRGAVSVWDPARGQEAFWSRGLICRGAGPVSWRSLAWHPDGRLACSGRGVVAVWHPESREDLLWCSGPHGSGPGVVAWHPDGRLAATASAGVAVWDPSTEGSPGLANRTLVRGLQVDAIAEPENCQQPIWRGRGQRYSASVAWLSDGRLASGSRDGTVVVWNPDPTEERASPVWEPGATASLVSLAWHPDGRLAGGEVSGAVAVWDADGGAKPCWRGHSRSGTWNSLAWHPDGRLASGGSPGVVALWDPAGSEEPLWSEHIFKAMANVYGVTWHGDGRLAVTDGNAVAVWDPQRDQEPRWRSTLPHHYGSDVRDWQVPSACAAWHPDGRLAAGSGWGTVAVWDPNKGEAPLWIRTLWFSEILGLEMTAVAWHPDGRLAWGSHDGTVVTRDSHGSEELGWRVQVHRGSIEALCWSPNGQWLAAATDRRRVSIHAAADGAALAEYATDDGVLALRWTPDSRQIWAADGGVGWERPSVYRLALEGRW